VKVLQDALQDAGLQSSLISKIRRGVKSSYTRVKSGARKSLRRIVGGCATRTQRLGALLTGASKERPLVKLGISSHSCEQYGFSQKTPKGKSEETAKASTEGQKGATCARQLPGLG